MPVRVIALILSIAALGIVNTTSSPANTGVEVAVAVALGKVAVCEPVPMLTKAWLGPSLTILTLLPSAARAVDALAVVVTATGRVSA